MTEVEPKAQRCALPGCEELIEAADGQKARKYCCAAHRVISRQQRREAEEQNAYQVMVAQSRAMASTSPSDLAPPAVTPEDVGAQDESGRPAAVESDAPVSPARKSRRRDRAAPRTAPEPAVAPATDWDAGADEEYESVPLLVDLDAMNPLADRPAADDGWDAVGNRRATRTPSPASAARAMRRSGPVPDAAARAIADHDGQSRERGRKRRTQAIALLGAAGILAGGGGWVVSNANASNDQRAAVGTSQPTSTDAQQWVRQAKVSLASISRQLDIAAQVEELWNRSPAAQNGGARPAAVQAMLDRKAALEQQRATVQSWLAAVESVDGVTAQLAQADAQLAAIDRALASPTSGPETAQVTQLRAQRDFVKQQRDVKAAELESLKGTVNHVVDQPLPDPASEQETEQLGQRVTNLANDPNAPEPGQENGRLVPVPAIAYRNDEGESNQDPGTGAPPRPGRGASDEQQPDPTGFNGAGDSGGGGSDAAAKAALGKEVANAVTGGGFGHADPASYNADPSGTTANAPGGADGASPNASTPANPTVGRGPNGEVLTTEQQIRYDGLQDRRAINDAELLAKRAADRQAKQVKLDKTRAAENKNLTPLQRQKKDIAREAKDLRVQSAQSQHDQLTLSQRGATRAQLDANPNASFRTGTPRATTVAAKTDDGKKQTKTGATTTTTSAGKQQKATTTASGTSTPTTTSATTAPTTAPSPAPAPLVRKT